MFIIEGSEDLGGRCQPDLADEANDMSTGKIIGFESARTALEQEKQSHNSLRALDRSSRIWGDFWVDLSLTVAISLAVLVCWFLVAVWLCRF
jgi:hypothetical protein